MNKKLLLTFLSALAVLAISCSRKSTDSRVGSIEGLATLEGQSDHGGILVKLRELGLQTITSTDGSYSFSAVPAGSYSLLATDGDTTRHLFDFAILQEISVVSGRTTIAPSMELPLFQRIEADLTGQERWSAEDGPYLIAQSVTVQPGAHLTIEPGTIIKFAGYYRLTILGGLMAKGTATDSILFTTMKAEGAPGDWDRISIEGPKEESDTLSYCRIEYANVGLSCQQTESVIFNNEVRLCFGYGIVTEISAPKVIGNLLRNNYSGISCENGSAATIQANIIRENTIAGIACTNSSPWIGDNVVSQNQYGLYTERECHPIVWHNQFFSNEDGIYLHYHCEPLIEANEISGQQRYGLYLSGYNDPQVHFNNIAQNGSYGAYLTFQPDNIQAQNNWWGTSDLSEIGALIWDVHDNPSQGEVLLDPILEAPVDSAGPRTLP